MASTGKYTKSPEMWKHLRPFLKRKFHKAERVAIKKDLDISDEELYDLEKLGLRKDFATMIKLRKEKGESIIPEGIYCLGCDYLDCAMKKEKQNNGFCWFLLEGDFDMEHCSLLWDGCKECGIKMDDGEV